MTCRELIDFLMQYLDGQLPPEQRAEFERHLAACGPCVNYLATYQEAVRMGKTLCAPEPDVPADVPEDLVKAVLAALKK